MRESSMRFGLRDAQCGGHDRIGRAIRECRQAMLGAPCVAARQRASDRAVEAAVAVEQAGCGSAHVRVACVGDLQ